MSLLPRPILRLALVEVAATAVIARLARPSHALVVLHAAPWSHGSFQPLAAPLAWWLAAVVTGWLIVSTIVAVAARVSPRCACVRGIESLGAAVITRYVDAAFAVALGVGLVASASGAAAAAPSTGRAAAGTTAPASSSTTAPVMVEVQPDGTLLVVPQGPSPGATTPSASPSSTTTTTTAGPPTPSAPVVPVPTALARVPAANVVVRAGDNLWHIASAHLAARRGRAVGNDEIAPYWRAVVAANRATLRSGDPNLIFPGELVTLPPLPPAQ